MAHEQYSGLPQTQPGEQIYNELVGLGAGSSFDLGSADGHTVCIIDHEISRNAAAERRTWDPADPPDQLTEIQRFEIQLMRELKETIAQDPAQGRLLCDALVGSDSVYNRSTAAVVIQELAKVDLQAALPLWEKLMADRDPGVRTSAYDSLLSSADDECLGSQMTLTQAAPLIAAYVMMMQGDE